MVLFTNIAMVGAIGGTSPSGATFTTLSATTYFSGDGSQGIKQTETSVTNFNIEIKDGLITSFIKN